MQKQKHNSHAPCILVERRHQLPPRVHACDSADDIIALAADIDNVSWCRFQNVDEVSSVFGDDRGDWPGDLARAVETDEWPIVVDTDQFGIAIGHEPEMPSEEDWAINVLGQDLYGLDLIESVEELDRYDPNHNPPSRRELERAREWLAIWFPQFERGD